MKSFVFTLTLMILGAGVAHAGNGDIGSVATAQYRCERAGGGFAFELPKASAPARVWLIDKAGDQEGLEIEVVKTNVFRCPNCYDITARMELFGEKAEYVFQLRGSGANFIPRLNVWLNGQNLNFKDVCKQI